MRGPRRKAYALSCTDPQWERIKARAHRHGSRSAARFVVERSLSGLAKPRPRLVLGEAEQRRLPERLARLLRAPEVEALMKRLEGGPGEG